MVFHKNAESSIYDTHVFQAIGQSKRWGKLGLTNQGGVVVNGHAVRGDGHEQVRPQPHANLRCPLGKVVVHHYVVATSTPTGTSTRTIIAYPCSHSQVTRHRVLLGSTAAHERRNKGAGLRVTERYSASLQLDHRLVREEELE